MNATITGDAICNSPLNHSKSKFMYSFGKAERFPRSRSTFFGSDFYNLPQVRMTRSTTFGYGNKYDFTRDAKSKSPVFYDFKSDFDEKHPHGPTYSFGLGRGNMYRSCEKIGPGPANYYYLKPFGSSGIKYSIKGKHERSKSTSMLESPGPGAYNSVSKINANGTYIVSKHENVHPVEFSKDKSKRFNYNYEISPGPSDYKKGSLFGKIFNSKFRSTNGVTMRPKFKIKDSRDCYPGPGAYGFFSEFGIYGKINKNKNKGNKENKENRESKEIRESKRDNEDNASKENRESKEMRESKEIRESKGNNEDNASKENRESKEETNKN